MSIFGGPKRLGLALGSGSARGLAHIGVIKALEQAGLRPDVVTGTSMGAVVGAMYAAGKTPEELEAIATSYDIKSLLALADVALQRGAVMAGEKVEAFLAEHLPERFEDLKIPFGCASTDLTTGHGVKHTAGDLRRAVRASLSIPVIFAPVTGDGHVLVDGFLTDPIPVVLARQLGAEVVVAVDVCGSGTVTAEDGQQDSGLVRDLIGVLRGEPRQRRRGTSGLEVLSASVEIMERHVARHALESADVVLSPDVHGYPGYDFVSAADIIAAGERAGRAAAKAIARKARRQAAG